MCVRGIIQILNTSLPNAFVAQRNRAFGFYPTGWGFESLRRHSHDSSAVERSPEEAGVGGSTPSLGTMKITLQILESGTIDLVEDGELYLQFNASCEDALPYCRARCCKSRPEINVAVDDNESFQTVDVVVRGKTLKVLDNIDGHCVYLENDLCKVHSHKPRSCSIWHCSPGGKGEGITIRDFGWKLTPAFRL